MKAVLFPIVVLVCMVRVNGRVIEDDYEKNDREHFKDDVIYNAEGAVDDENNGKPFL